MFKDRSLPDENHVSPAHFPGVHNVGATGGSPFAYIQCDKENQKNF